MRRVDVFRVSTLCLLTLAFGCADVDDVSDDEASSSVFRALTTAEGEYFDVVTWPREAIGAAMRSTGHLIVRLEGGPASTGPSSPPTEDDISGTCGVTFVSSRIAVTAGHCLRELSEYEQVEVRTPRVVAGFSPQPGIEGVFPNYLHFDAPGHDYDRYLCEVRAQCWTDRGVFHDINCDITAADVSVPFSQPSLDIGILDCEPIDGARHDYVDVASSVAANDGVVMPWYHELYEPPASELWASNFDEHYVQKGTWADNYHYRGGGERHQMLPLLSTDYYGSRWKVLFPPTGMTVVTNLRGCHGTSGSGVMRKDAADYPELIGPVAIGVGSINGPSAISAADDLLCHVPGADADGARTIDAMHPDVTRYFVDAYATPSCADPDSWPNRLAYWFGCDILSLDDLLFDTWQFRPRNCPWCLGFARFDHASMEAMRFSAAVPASLALRPNELGQTYRASVRVWTNDFPTTVDLRMGGTTIATHTFTGQDEDWLGNDASKVLSASFVADASTAGPLTVAVAQGSAAQEISVSGVLLVEDGQSSAFDTMHQRMSYGLLDLQDLGADARAMTFTAAETGGFAATLEPAQRMVATGLALTPDTAWHLALTGDQGALQCGLIFADGTETTLSCATNDGGVILDGTGQDAPVALYVQTDGAAAPYLSLSDLVVTEVAACATVHDTCETGAALDPACDACVASICNVDPYCCENAWDSICVGEVLSVCDQVHCDASAGSCAHSVCDTGTKLVSGCDTPVNPSCTAAICNVDPYCCATAWDWICQGEVASVCGLGCGAGG